MQSLINDLTRAALDLEENLIDGVVVIAAHGLVERSTAADLSDSLRTATIDAERAVMLDLRDVCFMDSSGLSVLVNALRRLGRQGRELMLVCAPGQVRRLLELSGLARTFTVYASPEDALARAG